MNRRGFTLIELLVVIVLIGLLGLLIIPGAINNINKAREKSYNLLIKNIVTASQTYYEECEYGGLSNVEKYGDYACSISDNTITTTLGAIAKTGFLNIKDIKENEDGIEIKIVKDPKTDNDISDCKIKITKVVDTSTYKVTYEIINIDTNDICPGTYQ